MLNVIAITRDAAMIRLIAVLIIITFALPVMATGEPPSTGKMVQETSAQEPELQGRPERAAKSVSRSWSEKSTGEQIMTVVLVPVVVPVIVGWEAAKLFCSVLGTGAGDLINVWRK